MAPSADRRFADTLVGLSSILVLGPSDVRIVRSAWFYLEGGEWDPDVVVYIVVRGVVTILSFGCAFVFHFIVPLCRRDIL